MKNLSWTKHSELPIWFFENGYHVAGSVELRDGKYLGDISTDLYEDEDGLDVDCKIVGAFDDLEAAQRAVELELGYPLQEIRDSIEGITARLDDLAAKVAADQTNSLTQ